MPVLSNPRHERFAQFFAQGKTASKAYELAGYKPNSGNAAQMAHKQHIKHRVAEINAELMGANVNQGGGQYAAAAWDGEINPRKLVTPKQLIERSERVYDRAVENHQYSAAVGCIREMGVLSGHRIERREVGPPESFDHLSDDELERALFERLKALGWAFDGVPLAISVGSTNGGVAAIEDETED